MAIEQTKAYRQLDAEYGAAVLYAIAILRAYGMNSQEFKVAEDAACDLWLRLREFKFDAHQNTISAGANSLTLPSADVGN